MEKLKNEHSDSEIWLTESKELENPSLSTLNNLSQSSLNSGTLEPENCLFQSGLKFNKDKNTLTKLFPRRVIIGYKEEAEILIETCEEYRKITTIKQRTILNNHGKEKKAILGKVSLSFPCCAATQNGY